MKKSNSSCLYQIIFGIFLLALSFVFTDFVDGGANNVGYISVMIAFFAGCIFFFNYRKSDNDYRIISNNESKIKNKHNLDDLEQLKEKPKEIDSFFRNKTVYICDKCNSFIIRSNNLNDISENRISLDFNPLGYTKFMNKIIKMFINYSHNCNVEVVELKNPNNIQYNDYKILNFEDVILGKINKLENTYYENRYEHIEILKKQSLLYLILNWNDNSNNSLEEAYNKNVQYNLNIMLLNQEDNRETTRDLVYDLIYIDVNRRIGHNPKYVESLILLLNDGLVYDKSYNKDYFTEYQLNSFHQLIKFQFNLCRELDSKTHYFTDLSVEYFGERVNLFDNGDAMMILEEMFNRELNNIN